MQHLTIYRNKTRYAGWPANYGIWAWGDEIVVGFTLGYPNPAGGYHTRDRSKPFLGMQARSLDGGLTWQVEETPCRVPGNRGLSADEHLNPKLHIGSVLADENAPIPCPGDIDFTQPDFALMCARSGLRAGAVSWFYLSTDRCRTWVGPFALPMFWQQGIAARTDYLVSGPRECTLFLTATKADGDEGRVFCARTIDGGQHFDFLSWVGPEPSGYSIMPASLRLSKTRILVARRNRAGNRCWIDLYASDDAGASWQFLTSPAPNSGYGGNPPTLTKLHDSRLCLIYGYRDAPFGIRARLSQDDGLTWGEEIILRDDGGNHDLGYPRTVQRPDGTVVTVYYYNDQAEGERYIGATLWKPG